MIDPVMSKNGVTYERKAILEWLLNNKSTTTSQQCSCPLTRQPLKPSMLVSNAALKIKILQWKVDNGIKCHNDNDHDDDYDDTTCSAAATTIAAATTTTARPISLRNLYFDYSTLLNNNNDMILKN